MASARRFVGQWRAVSRNGRKPMNVFHADPAGCCGRTLGGHQSWHMTVTTRATNVRDGAVTATRIADPATTADSSNAPGTKLRHGSATKKRNAGAVRISEWNSVTGATMTADGLRA